MERHYDSEDILEHDLFLKVVCDNVSMIVRQRGRIFAAYENFVRMIE